MTEERIRELESVGFDWRTSRTDWRTSRTAFVSIWGARLQQLRKYKIQSGHCLVPYQYSANSKLERWVGYQCAQYKLFQEGKPSRITDERSREFESIGFDWGTGKTCRTWKESQVP